MHCKKHPQAPSKHDIDAYFAMHDALDEILKTQRHQTAAKNLNQKIEKPESKQQKEKQSQKQRKNEKTRSNTL
ncbi:hypothetical protein [Acinetobacter sp. 1564232]|uniref:hypothetical protein n=1 Tax=Acinetobacter sp. 1564232 TaxID=1310723 RepID=UPI000449D42A|nr:hypothetical protein [Acinetobacter sp. 1564232]EYT24376.1 hypothetical protein J622_03636 [Acinetobacter sp. 1564232]